MMNGPLKFLTARKMLPLLNLLAKFKQVLACSCSPNFCSCLQARKANFLFLLVLAKKLPCSACSRMLAKTIRHPLNKYEFMWPPQEFENVLILSITSYIYKNKTKVTTWKFHYFQGCAVRKNCKEPSALYMWNPGFPA